MVCVCVKAFWCFHEETAILINTETEVIELHWSIGTGLSIWVCSHLYLRTNIFLAELFSFPLTCVSLFSRFSILPVLKCNAQYSSHDIFCETFSLDFQILFLPSLFLVCPPPQSPHPDLLLSESFPRRERRPRPGVTSRNSEKNSN